MEVVEKIGFVSQDPFIFTGTVDDNLLYACKAITDENTRIEPSIDDKISVLQKVGLFVDILRFGLNTALDSKLHPDLEEKILRVRENFQINFGQELSEYVEFYREDRYLYHSSLMENLIFGTPMHEDFMHNKLVDNRKFISFLDSCNLQIPLLETGAELLLQTVSILGDVSREDIFFAQTPIRANEYSTILKLAEKMQETPVAQLDREEQRHLLDISLRFIPSVHKIIALQPLLEKLVLGGRISFRHWCADNAPDSVVFYSDTLYIGSQSILNNIFYGNLTSNSPKVEDRVNQCIVFLLVEEDLLEQVVAIGMNFDVGNKGDNLSGGQQQKMAIARVLLKQPTVLILDEATSALDNKSQGRVHKVMEQWKGTCTVISVIHRLDMLGFYDKVAVMKAGRIVECGKLEELIAEKGVLYELIHGKNN